MSIQPLRPGSRPQREPPRNSEGEITCVHMECKDEQLTFKRLCEFNKHMDKHERPYKCNNSACKKNPGFTYAGGLLRHQREVHSMHRTKEPFYCPHTNCNRSTGAGFSRRENLEEHLRRRHSGVGVGADDADNRATTTPPTTTSPMSIVIAAKPEPSPVVRYLEPLPPSRKRRLEAAPSPADDDGGGLDTTILISTSTVESQLRQQIMLLRQDNERLKADLFQQEQHLLKLSTENKRLCAMLQPHPVSVHSVYDQRGAPMT